MIPEGDEGRIIDNYAAIVLPPGKVAVTRTITVPANRRWWCSWLFYSNGDDTTRNTYIVVYNSGGLILLRSASAAITPSSYRMWPYTFFIQSALPVMKWSFVLKAGDYIRIWIDAPALDSSGGISDSAVPALEVLV